LITNERKSIIMGKDNQKKAASPAPQTQNKPAEAQPQTTRRSTLPTHTISLWDRFAVTWLSFIFFIHACFDAVWFFNFKTIGTAPAVPSSAWSFFALFREAAKHENYFSAVQDTFTSVIKSLLKAYALADKRMATGDTFLRAFFGFNLYFTAPLVLILAYGIAHRRWWRHNLQLVVTTAQLAGLALYFATEHFNGYANTSPKSVKYYNVYFWAGNLAIAAPSALLFLQSFFSRPHTLSAKGPSHRISFTVKFLFGSLFLGTLFLLAGAVAHHHLDSKEVEKLLLDAYQTSSQYANDAYQAGYAAGSEAVHQAHILAAPYVDQAADYVFGK